MSKLAMWINVLPKEGRDSWKRPMGEELKSLEQRKVYEAIARGGIAHIYLSHIKRPNNSHPCCYCDT